MAESENVTKKEATGCEKLMKIYESMDNLERQLLLAHAVGMQTQAEIDARKKATA